MTQSNERSPAEPQATSSGLGPEDEARLLRMLEAAEAASEEAQRALEAAGSAANRRSGEMDSISDGAQRLVSRGRDVKANVQHVRDMLERAKLTALNAGLEGARLGEPIGKVMVSVSDELRVLLARSIDEIDDHSNLLVEIERERERWLSEINPVFEGCRALGSELSRIHALQRASSSALGTLGSELRRAIGGDPEALAMIAEASELAHNLAKVLSTIAEKRPDQLSGDTLGRLLEPLLSLAAPPGRAQSP